MANFILVKSEGEECLLNLDTIQTITPYESAYDDGEVKGVMIKHVDAAESILYEGVDFEEVKRKLVEQRES